MVWVVQGEGEVELVVDFQTPCNPPYFGGHLHVPRQERILLRLFL